MNKNFHFKNYSPGNAVLTNERVGYRPVVNEQKAGISQLSDAVDVSVENIPLNKILAAYSAESFSQISSFLEKVSFCGDEYIHQPDDTIYYVYFPETVVMSELQILEDGRTVETAMIGKEGVTGLSTLFNSQSVNCWTQVSLPGDALRIDLQILKEEFDFGGTIQSLLFDFVSSYIRQVSQRVVCNTHHAIENRLCNWLLMLNDRCGSKEFPMTQEKIARFLGVHRPSISNIAGSLREKNVIDYTRGKIIILNRELLEHTACPCYRQLQENLQPIM